jgi:hypothetical protein
MMRRIVALGVVVSTVSLTCPGAVTVNGACPGETDFCAPRLARDFLRPLSRLAPIDQVPRSGRLPFAPKGVTLEPRGGQLIVGGGMIGFGFSDAATGKVRPLNWNVRVQLYAVDAQGDVIRKVGTKRRNLGALNGNRIKAILFKVPGRPAFYRIDISFRRRGNDRLLGSFSNYVRVVRPWFDARLLIPRAVAKRGELFSARLANFGTEGLSSISHDWRFTVERLIDQEWVVAPSNPPPEKHILLIRKLGPGEMDKCIHFRIPANEEPGLYRFSMVVERSLKGGKDRSVQVTTEFTIPPEG